MADEVKTAAGEQGKETQTDAGAGSEQKTEQKPEQTVAEILGNEKPKAEEKLVPESALLEFKKQNKEMQKQIKNLEKQITEGATRKESSDAIEALKKKYPESAEFIDEYTSIIRGSQTKETPAPKEETPEEEPTTETKSKESPEERQARIDRVFDENYTKALDQLPEFKDLANKEVVKTLFLDPKNASKTLGKIFEEAYGHLVQGKKSIDSSKPQGGKGNNTIDFERAAKDTEYYKEIMANPDLKKEYNERLAQRLKL